MTRTAIVVVDVQQDFCEGGALEVRGGHSVAEAIADYIDHIPRDEDSVYLVVATKDWHIDPGSHFSDHPDFVDSWPSHCVADTPGAEFEAPLSDGDFDEIFYKGQLDASYSGFEGTSLAGVTLEEYLRRNDVELVAVVGLAFDYCVAATARDSVKLGFNTFVISEFTAAVSRDSVVPIWRELMKDGVIVV